MEGLDDLLSLLKRVKTKGWDDAFPDNLYDNDSKEAIRRNPTSSGHLSTFLNAIEEARVCMSALNEAQRRVGKRLRCLRRLSKPFVLEDGIKRIPDDVLAIVFEMGHHFGGGRHPFAVGVSHVSRRFRSQPRYCGQQFTNPMEKVRFENFFPGQVDLISTSKRTVVTIPSLF
ncbi:hypothetical protein BD410DRAFT_399400 [Rickenella mellea]|uniref:Uncharacterized protein n=1 Tax=Rickenella mellea TaxID=50990 RepID=A0A4Y7PE34_9AGAM|nr:hypothetical protein BD410DRAFT_399400 [Rickenella mellea]